MLILGEKYTFTDIELQRLSKRFKTIEKIVYSSKSSDDIKGFG